MNSKFSDLNICRREWEKQKSRSGASASFLQKVLTGMFFGERTNPDRGPAERPGELERVCFEIYKIWEVFFDFEIKCDKM